MTLYQITYERVGRHGSKRPDSPPAPPPYQLRAADVDELAQEIHRDVRRYLGSRYVEVAVNLEEMRGLVLAGEREAGSFTIAVIDAPAAPVEQVEAEVLAETATPELPTVTKAGLGYLQRFAAAEADGDPVYVYREFTRPGNGVSRPALDRLLGTDVGDALVKLGDHDPQRGRPVTVTDLGRRVLAAGQAGAR
ncbi:hypothetical protein ABH931_006112 [Streptacidiphilus sp. MAP12-33]|uniref:hypothetical protein n=1 Tax=Streptacidiphilus sp. MAP12-33 TaxID=3156266 RepID=UPI003514309C